VKTLNYANGLLLSCLLLLAACGSVPPSPEQTHIVTGCPAVTLHPERD
jgi:starvation-inducible outer membrane lipoprotein